jgi:hypothetical protein
MPGEFQKGKILLAHRMYDSDGAHAAAPEPHNRPPRAAKLALKRLRIFGWHAEMLLEKSF